MVKLCANGKATEILKETVEKLCGYLFALQQDNDGLKERSARDEEERRNFQVFRRQNISHSWQTPKSMILHFILDRTICE